MEQHIHDYNNFGIWINSWNSCVHVKVRVIMKDFVFHFILEEDEECISQYLLEMSRNNNMTHITCKSSNAKIAKLSLYTKYSWNYKTKLYPYSLANSKIWVLKTIVLKLWFWFQFWYSNCSGHGHPNKVRCCP